MVYQKFRYTAKEISLKMSCADPETFVWRAGYYRPYSGFAIEMAFRWPADCGPPRGFGDLGGMAIYFQGSEEHWQLF